MSSREMLRIESRKRNALEQHMLSFPVKLGSLAKDLGVSSIKISSMGTGISGQIARENGEYTIRVNRNESRERQRFTIAHELAHYLLHKDIIDSSPDGITDNVLYRSGEPDIIEYEANRLAADIIMPLNLVQNELKNRYKGIITEATIEGLAAKFQVSKAAMEIRLSTLAEA